MRENTFTVIWKGVKSGPFTREQLENEFTEGRIGMVRTILCGNTTVPGRNFVADMEIRSREEELEKELRYQEQQAEAVREELVRKQEEHRQQLEEATRRVGKTTPPPIPDVNPWAPQGGVVAPTIASMSSSPGGEMSVPRKSNKVLDQYLIISAVLLCVLSLLTGHLFREGGGILAVVIGIVLLVRRRISAGVILITAAIISYGAGLLFSDLIHDYLIKNYPH